MTEWFDEQGVADPGDQGRGGDVGVAAGGLQGPGQEGFDLGGGRGVAFEEVAALGHERDAGRCRLGLAARDGWEIDAWGHGVHSYFSYRTKARNIKQIMFHTMAAD